METLNQLKEAIYADNCLSVSRCIKEHLIHLRKLLTNLWNQNITVNLKEKNFFRKEIQYLGFKLTNKGIQPTEEKITAIQNFSRTKNNSRHFRFLLSINLQKNMQRKSSHY